MGSKYIDIAVIVEMREHCDLKPVIENVLFELKDVNILLFHGNKNKNYILNVLSEYLEKISLINLNVDNLTVRQYSNLLLKKSFWNQIKYERILLFQTDSCICNFNEDILLECQKYDFVGAPSNLINRMYWQNGGFSFRRTRKMIESIDKIKLNYTVNEDCFFSIKSNKIIKVAPFELANKFSVEINYYDKPFGVHKFWNYHDKDIIKKLVNNNPNLNIFNRFYN